MTEKWDRKRLDRAMKHAGLTQAQMAEIVGVSQPTICTWLKGTREPAAGQHLEAVLDAIIELESPRRSLQEDWEDAPDEVGEIGQWIIAQRTQLNWSRKRLAEKTGLSALGIALIESGKTRNPQAATLKKLQKAFKTPVPAAAAAAAMEETNIVGMGALRDFDPHDEDSFPNLPGVYVVYDVASRPTYVGKGKRIRDRLSRHQEKKWWIPQLVARGSYLEIPDDELRDKIEQLLINFLRSELLVNIQGMDRD